MVNEQLIVKTKLKGKWRKQTQRNEKDKRGKQAIKAKGKKKKFSDRTLATAAALLVFLLIMEGGYFGIQYYLYWERGSPVIEHIPVLDGSEGQNVPDQIAIILPEMTDSVRNMKESAGEESQTVQDGNWETGETPDTTMPETQQGSSAGSKESQEDKGEELTEGTISSESPDSENPVDDTASRQEDTAGTSDLAGFDQQIPKEEAAYSIQTEYASEEETIQDHQDGLSLDAILGDIFSGDELVKVILFIRNEGMRVFVRTKQNGEGEFSKGQIDAFCDPSCSYLAAKTDTGYLLNNK